MLNKNELILVNKILNTELSIRQMAKQFGLRRDDFVNRIREMIKDDEELTKQLDLVLIINQMLYADMPMEEASSKLGITEQELDIRIKQTLKNNLTKMHRYEEYLNPSLKERKFKKNANILKKYTKQKKNKKDSEK